MKAERGRTRRAKDDCLASNTSHLCQKLPNFTSVNSILDRVMMIHGLEGRVLMLIVSIKLTG